MGASSPAKTKFYVLDMLNIESGYGNMYSVE